MMHGRVSIEAERCKGCALCVTACVPRLLSLAEDRFNAHGHRPVELLDPDGRCTGCGLCAVICPDICLTVFRTAGIQPPEGGRRAPSAAR